MKYLLKLIAVCIVLVSVVLGYDFFFDDENVEAVPAISSVKQERQEPDIVIHDKKILWTANREELIKQYSKLHYGKNSVKINPQAIVLHWTASDNMEGVYNYFYDETMPDDGGGTLNVASHFLVDRDGTIYRLTEENVLNRHAIGYNWCSIGIENVGGVEGREDLTEQQVQANINLIKYLKYKYPEIKYVWGHYQQEQAKSTGLFIENIPDYYAVKIDPGTKFMSAVGLGLKNENIKIFTD